jgi:hypothetical protein
VPPKETSPELEAVRDLFDESWCELYDLQFEKLSLADFLRCKRLVHEFLSQYVALCLKRGVIAPEVHATFETKHFLKCRACTNAWEGLPEDESDVSEDEGALNVGKS